MRSINDIVRIHELKSQGLTNKAIAAIIGCSNSLISYHTGPNSTALAPDKRKDVDKTLERFKRLRNKIQTFKENTPKVLTEVQEKVEEFMCRSCRERRLKTAIVDFSRGSKRNMKSTTDFKLKDVVDKFGEDTICYLTGRKINLINDNYHLDHIVPSSKGGPNTLDNLGIACREANQAKHDLSKDQLIELCKEILIHNGYKISN